MFYTRKKTVHKDTNHDKQHTKECANKKQCAKYDWFGSTFKSLICHQDNKRLPMWKDTVCLCMWIQSHALRLCAKTALAQNTHFSFLRYTHRLIKHFSFALLFFVPSNKPPYQNERKEPNTAECGNFSIVPVNDFSTSISTHRRLWNECTHIRNGNSLRSH